MPTSRRSLLAAAGAGLSLDVAEATGGQPSGSAAVAAELAVISEKANSALMEGDIRRYLAMVPLAPDFVLMSPFGGTPSHGGNHSPEQLDAIGRFFRNGSLRQEVVHTYASAAVVVLAVIERAHVEVGGLPAQDWALRVTLVYRREGSKWLLVHRHADPLANGISVEQAALLARGASPRA
jgi:ketosteroid isomerase-like protein